MNKFILFLVFNASVFGHTSAECTPNEVFKNDCNTCICSEDGMNAICTLMECIKVPIIETTEVNILTTTTEEAESSTDDVFEHNTNNVAVNTNGNQVCTPNEIKMQVENNDICNRCKCAANGIGWFCTKIPCPAREVHKRTAKRSVARRGCRPGDILSDGCNHCVCDSFGIPSCTHLPCIDMRYKRSTAQDKKCTPGEKWKVDCNDCFCTETGVGACTLRGCLGSDYTAKFRISTIAPEAIRKISMDEYRQSDFKCTPHEYFKLECNYCKCNSEGSGAKCTKKRCPNEPRQ